MAEQGNPEEGNREPWAFKWLLKLLQLPVFITAVGGVIGYCSSSRSAENARQYAEEQLRRQHETELRETSYARLMGLKLAVAQAVQTHVDARVSAETNYLAFRRSGSPGDLQFARSEKDRAEAALVRLSEVLRELFQTLGDIKISFAPTAELDRSVKLIYEFKSAFVDRPDPKKYASEESVEALEKGTREWTQKYVTDHFATPIEQLVTEMKRQLDSTRPKQTP